MPQSLADLAQSEYGNLIVRIYEFDGDLGIDVHLIGGQVVQYFPNGQRYHVEQPSAWDKAMRFKSGVRGRLSKVFQGRGAQG